MDEGIPPKQYYTIGEVSRLTGVKPHVLRYWETRGKILRPSRRRSRHRLYRPADIQLILEIKRLREEERLPLAALRRQVEARRSPGPAPGSRAWATQVAALLRELMAELEALRELLEE
ncbi:MAG: MerR family transcriptional regulator [Desulfobaccales bacterium]